MIFKVAIFSHRVFSFRLVTVLLTLRFEICVWIQKCRWSGGGGEMHVKCRARVDQTPVVSLYTQYTPQNKPQWMIKLISHSLSSFFQGYSVGKMIWNPKNGGLKDDVPFHRRDFLRFHGSFRGFVILGVFIKPFEGTKPYTFWIQLVVKPYHPLQSFWQWAPCIPIVGGWNSVKKPVNSNSEINYQPQLVNRISSIKVTMTIADFCYLGSALGDLKPGLLQLHLVLQCD